MAVHGDMDWGGGLGCEKGETDSLSFPRLEAPVGDGSSPVGLLA